ncbi:hypothetical protein Y1Q_0023190 [Alligator mississippiensis]|uniref:Uncharacterized protein n=1 Tax=Alligator mississippiensis TaxID=8496 RepID=A0A151MZA5_ALLMI|nr:hypothetical protein Y1Q_0023190 [Alligator mississippiensis]
MLGLDALHHHLHEIRATTLWPSQDWDSWGPSSRDGVGQGLQQDLHISPWQGGCQVTYRSSGNGTAFWKKNVNHNSIRTFGEILTPLQFNSSFVIDYNGFKFDFIWILTTP